ncbi:PhzF family phenazine biosynthesis protein [Phreatobacter stygius]|uniref:PhzF family phenazine biosynthesis protein n=2 Tax=Phreatobacter stygius TaxID=1940610 RepID=A0A4D7BNR3_9HYPH|nr:PhzF family phenazine biosynthesis protein [Phreatobacter stygius]
MYQVDAFASRIFAGNPAAVLVLDDWLAVETMQAIAEENNLAETAFARPSGKGWDLRWFTPTTEVNFCGHATLATAHVLATELNIPGDFAFATRVGELRVARQDGAYVMDLPCLPPEPIGDEPTALTAIFGDRRRATFRNFENLFVELEDEAALRAFVPDLMTIATLVPPGLVITAKAETHDFVSRYFVPAEGIPEDPVTGSIHATLVPYWAGKLGKTRLSALQCSKRGGHLLCELAGDRVLLTGQAVTFMTATIHLPD